MVFKFQREPIASGMGTSGFVQGYIPDSYSTNSIGVRGLKLYLGILLLHFLLPAIITLGIAKLMRRKGWIKDGDLKLDL